MAKKNTKKVALETTEVTPVENMNSGTVQKRNGEIHSKDAGNRL